MNRYLIYRGEIETWIVERGAGIWRPPDGLVNLAGQAIWPRRDRGFS